MTVTELVLGGPGENGSGCGSIKRRGSAFRTTG